jgi:transketolase N-terminal domain/subunit
MSKMVVFYTVPMNAYYKLKSWRVKKILVLSKGEYVYFLYKNFKQISICGRTMYWKTENKEPMSDSLMYNIH